MNFEKSDTLKFISSATKKNKPKSCPICKRVASTQYEPFCSNRCKEKDLGNWITGSYYIAGASISKDIANDIGDQILV